jgi:hypothetical protein
VGHGARVGGIGVAQGLVGGTAVAVGHAGVCVGAQALPGVAVRLGRGVTVAGGPGSGTLVSGIAVYAAVGAVLGEAAGLSVAGAGGVGFAGVGSSWIQIVNARMRLALPGMGWPMHSAMAPILGCPWICVTPGSMTISSSSMIHCVSEMTLITPL